MSKKPRYAVSKTLLDGEPDCNRRIVLDSWSEFREVAVFNPHMEVWTPQREKELQLAVKALERGNA